MFRMPFMFWNSIFYVPDAIYDLKLAFSMFWMAFLFKINIFYILEAILRAPPRAAIFAQAEQKNIKNDLKIPRILLRGLVAVIIPKHNKIP